MYLQGIGTEPGFRPQGWERRCAQWSASSSPSIRELVLQVQPAPLNQPVADCLTALVADPYTEVAEAACEWLKKEKHPAAIPGILKQLDETDSEHLSRSCFEAAVFQGA